ncbi:MAG: glycosyltransferase, partial [Fibrella sp.]|nr:glycosyltransferase [Armatimonadota bacterium]
MDLSVIIVNWNTKALLLDCLKTVKDNISSSGSPTEVFIVDNGSHDGSEDAVRDAFPDFGVFVSPQNLGFAGGNNVALKLASGRYCLL